MRHRRRFDGWELFILIGCAATLIWYLGNGVQLGTLGPTAVVTVLAIGAVTIRKRLPFVAIGVALIAAIGASFVATPSIQLWTAVQLVLLSVALTVGMKRSIRPAIAVGATLFASEIVIYGESAISGLALGMVSWTLGVWGLAAAVTSERREANAWEDRARHLQRSREEEIRRHIVEERLRIARDLHDELGHDIAVIGINAGAADANLIRDPESSRAALKTVREATRRVLVELQQILGVLRADHDDASPPGTIADLLDTARQSGLDLRSSPIDTATLAPDGIAAAYRAVQEALTNAGKHGSGQVFLESSTRDGRWFLTISNPVKADVSTSAGFGLIGMRERVEQAGGRLRIIAGDEEFTVIVELPQAEGKAL